MAARKRIISQSEAVFVGPYSGDFDATGVHWGGGDNNSGENLVKQLSRIQNANYSFNITRQDVNQFGQLAAISREVVEAPTVGLDISYYLTDGSNEDKLGFTVAGAGETPVSFISGILNDTSNEKNYFLLTVPEGNDAAGYAGDADLNGVAGFGNGFITNYTAQGAVGGIPTASVTVEALNMKFDVGSTGKAIPAVDPVNGLPITTWTYDIPAAVSGSVGEPAALRPGDITVEVGNAGLGVSGMCIQSFNLGVGLARNPLQCLGSRFAFTRELQYPITATMTVEANMKDPGVGALSDVLCNDSSYDLSVLLRKPNCSGAGDPAIRFDLKNAKLDSQNFAASIGASKTVSMQFSAQVGGPQDLVNGLFMSGSY